jgi:hypothetical protein
MQRTVRVSPATLPEGSYRFKVGEAAEPGPGHRLSVVTLATWRAGLNRARAGIRSLAHPERNLERTKIKQKFRSNGSVMAPFFPPKRNLNNQTKVH